MQILDFTPIPKRLIFSKFQTWLINFSIKDAVINLNDYTVVGIVSYQGRPIKKLVEGTEIKVATDGSSFVLQNSFVDITGDVTIIPNLIVDMFQLDIVITTNQIDTCIASFQVEVRETPLDTENRVDTINAFEFDLKTLSYTLTISAAEAAEKAKTSETNAKNSETAAKTSETNAKNSETAAKTSETNAKNSETAAKTSETNAKNSETAAKTSETNAKNSETAAKTSETNAKNSETIALQKANELNTLGYISNWDVSTNTPAPNTNIATGSYYIVSVGGTSNITGSSETYQLFDQLRKTATGWSRIPFSLMPALSPFFTANDSITKYVKLQKNAVFVETSVSNWQTATSSNVTATLEGMSIPATQLIFPATAVVQANPNIWGINLQGGNLVTTAGTKLRVYVAIYSSVAITNIKATVDNTDKAKVNATNATSLKVGWNFFWWEVEFLINVVPANTCYLVFANGTAQNNQFFGSTIIFTPFFNSNNLNYSYSDYLISKMITDIEANTTLVNKLNASMSGVNRLGESISMNELLDANYSYYTKVGLDSWQTDTTKSSNVTRNRNGVVILGTEFVFGTLTQATGGSNGNVWGINLYNGLRVANTVITVLLSVYSDRDIPLLTPSLYFANNNATIIEHNFNSLKAGWNSKYVKVKITANVIANEMEFLLFERGLAGNMSMAGATMFVEHPIISDSNISFLDVNILKLLSAVNSINTKTAALTNNAEIECIGDSLTAGALSEKTRNKDAVLAKFNQLGINVSTLQGATPYPLVMNAILGSNYTVNNLGVGGENINTIAARIGASPALVPTQFVLPATQGTNVVIANTTDNTLKSSFDAVSAVLPLLQGNVAVNPCYVEGVECTLTQTVGSYTLTRTGTGSRDVVIPAGTPIIMQGAKRYRNPRAAIIWCWQNGGYASDAELIDKLDKIISTLGTTNYVIVGLHTSTASARVAQEAALQAKYGVRFFNWRRYVSTNALLDFGITPTTDADFSADQLNNGVKSDTFQMGIGSLPSSLWGKVYGTAGDTSNDTTHLNAAGYMILGYKLVERLKLIGM